MTSCIDTAYDVIFAERVPVRVVEGDDVNLTIVRSGSGREVSRVKYRTVDGLALHADNDYTAAQVTGPDSSRLDILWD